MIDINKLVDQKLNESIINEETSYQVFFKSMLKKYGISSPMKLDPDKRKLFFQDIKNGWAKEKSK